MRVVIDHIAGTRRGQRQELAADARIRFGRHPECEVAFDPHRDLDASSRHAELRPADTGWVLVDLGSSNGTYVGGHRVTEASIRPGVPAVIDFGSGGPRIRLFVGEADAIAALPAAPVERAAPRWLLPVIGAALALVALVVWLAIR